MAVLQWNIRGLRPNLAELSVLVNQHCPRVVCLQETKLPDGMDFGIRGFTGYHQYFSENQISSGEDAEDVGDENPYASLVPENESLYLDDPKKELKGFYEREGCDLPDYQFTEAGVGKHKCTLDLPVDGPNGEDLIAEATVSGKRKDAVIACALEACRMLDKLGLLRSSKHESRKRKQKTWEDDDYYDSDEDTFLDRTGTIEKKRFMRMRKLGKDEPETFESLMEKFNQVTKEINDIEGKLEKAQAEAEARAGEEVDELDAYMNSIKSGAMDTKTRMRLKADLLKLRAEEQRLTKLVNIARPASLPALKPRTQKAATTTVAQSKKVPSQPKQMKIQLVTTKMEFELKPDDYEEHDEEEDTEAMDSSASTSDHTQMETDCEEQKIKQRLQDKKEVADLPQSSTKEPSLPPPKAKREEKLKVKPSHEKSVAAVLKAEKSLKESTDKSKNFDSSHPDYAMWLPPEGQSGDGRTSLNAKLGY